MKGNLFHYTVAGLIAVVALIHLLPLSGVLGGPQLTQLYGIELADANLVILLRHRAVLFGLLGLFLIWGALRPERQWAALGVGAISVVSFLAIAYAEGGANAQLERVVLADWVALGALALAALVKGLARSKAAGGPHSDSNKSSKR